MSQSLGNKFIQDLVLYNTYARWLEDKQRRETWPEVCSRVMAFLKQGKEAKKIPGAIWTSLEEAMLRKDVLPSMRIVQMAGPSLDRCHVGAYNCAYTVLEGPKDLAELLYILMQGTGVGYSVERKYVEKWPQVESTFMGHTDYFTVPDSTEGWADAFKYAIEQSLAGRRPKFDYTQIRPEGEWLHTKGGRASGPKPLEQLLEKTWEIISARAGQRLRPIDVHRLATMCGSIVQVGGVRRAAELALFDADDMEMLSCKNGKFWETMPELAMANNSVVATGPVSDSALLSWMAQLSSNGTGEPGVFRRDGAMPVRRAGGHEFGTNPCFAAGTLIQTRTGHFPIETLVGKVVDVWDGRDWCTTDNFRVTGENQPLLQVELHDGTHLKVTPYHTLVLEDGSKIEARDVVPGQMLKAAGAPLTHGTTLATGAYVKGFLVGDGTQSGAQPMLWVYRPKYGCVGRLVASIQEVPVGQVQTNAIEAVTAVSAGRNRQSLTGLGVRKTELLPWATTYKQGLPADVFAWDLASKCEFIAGLMDADGCASDTANGFMYQLSSVSRPLLADVQLLLKTMGVASKLALSRAAVVGKELPGGTYDCQALWRLTVSQRGAIALAKQVTFSRLVSFAEKKVSYTLQSKALKVIRVTDAGVADKVYCCTVEPTHTIGLTSTVLSGQCGEIILRPRQFCNLSVAVARPTDTAQTLEYKVNLATIFGTLQSCLTNFAYLQDEWKVNCEEERLLGVDITGACDCPLLTNPDTTPRLLSHLRDVAIEVNKGWAQHLGVPQSAAVTCNKPSGNSAQFLDTSSGIHARYAPYYIRRLRVAGNSPIGLHLQQLGLPVYPEVSQGSLEEARIWVVELPVKSPDGALVRDQLSAVDQLSYWLMWKQNWTEHNPSCTVYVHADEWVSVASFLKLAWKDVGGLSFLPKDNSVYALAPYEEITAEEYEQRLAALPASLDLESIREQVDTTTINSEFACVGNLCEI